MAATTENGGLAPRAWSLNEWYVQNSLWRTATPDGGRAGITPEVAEAYSGHHWLVTYEVGEQPLRPGSHIALEIPAGWTPHLGRPLHGGRQLLVPAETISPGYAAWARVEAGEEARFELTVSDCTRFHVLDAVLLEGEVPAGGEASSDFGRLSVTYRQDGGGVVARTELVKQVVPLKHGAARHPRRLRDQLGRGLRPKPGWVCVRLAQPLRAMSRRRAAGAGREVCPPLRQVLARRGPHRALLRPVTPLNGCSRI